MKITYLILSLALFMNQPVSAEQKRLYSEKGFPYKNILSKADKVKVIYLDDVVTMDKLGEFSADIAEQGEIVQCRVEINWKDNELTTEKYRVSKDKFEKAPLATCLPRKLAKQYLAALRSS